METEKSLVVSGGLKGVSLDEIGSYFFLGLATRPITPLETHVPSVKFPPN
jgi:hypothetical protein